MRRRVKGLVVVLAAAAACAIGCLDVSPVTVTRPDASRPDVTPFVDAGDAEVSPPDTRSPCRDCAEARDEVGPGCTAEIAKCATMKPCIETYHCAFASGCLENHDFKGAIDCGIPCAQAAGVVDQTSPEAFAILDVLTCLQTTCRVACNNGDDAGGK